VLKGLADWILKPLVTGVIGAIALAVMAPYVISVAGRIQPTCADHLGLKPYNVASLYPDHVHFDSKNTASQPNDNYDPSRYEAARVFDGRLTSVWAEPVDPPPRPAGADSPVPLGAAMSAAANRSQALATLSVDFDDPLPNVRLICLVNGVPLDPASYERADRVRDATYETVCDDDSHRSTVVSLRSMPAGAIQEGQRLPASCRKLKGLSLSINTTYPGSTVVDPDTRAPVRATNLVAVAEVTLYGPVGSTEPGYSGAFAVVDWVARRPIWQLVLASLTVIGLLAIAARPKARETAEGAEPAQGTAAAGASSSQS
jgi:hypothetical protein